MRYDIKRFYTINLVGYVAKTNEELFKTVLMSIAHKYFHISNKIKSDYATCLKLLSIFEIVSN